MIKISFDRVLVKMLDKRFVESEIYLLTDEEEPLMGEVVQLGDGRNPDTGKISAFDVQLGDTVMFSAHMGEKIDDCRIMRENEILGVIDD